VISPARVASSGVRLSIDCRGCEPDGLGEIHPAGLRTRGIAKRPQEAIFREADTANGAKIVIEAPLEPVPGGGKGEGEGLFRGGLCVHARSITDP
jgi:hypothetical protein